MTKSIKLLSVFLFVLGLVITPIKQAEATGIPTVDILKVVQDYLTQGPPGPIEMMPPLANSNAAVTNLISQFSNVIGVPGISGAPTGGAGPVSYKDSKNPFYLVNCNDVNVFSEADADNFFSSLSFLLVQSSGLPYSEINPGMRAIEKSGKIGTISKFVADPEAREQANKTGMLSEAQQKQEFYKQLLKMKYGLRAKAAVTTMVAEKCYEDAQKPTPTRWVKVDGNDPIIKTASMLDSVQQFAQAVVTVDENAVAANYPLNFTVAFEDNGSSNVAMTDIPVAPSTAVIATESVDEKPVQVASLGDVPVFSAEPISYSDPEPKSLPSIPSAKGQKLAQLNGGGDLNLNPLNCLPDLSADFPNYSVNRDISLGCLGSANLGASFSLPKQYTSFSDYLSMCGPNLSMDCSLDFATGDLPKCPINLQDMDPAGAIFSKLTPIPLAPDTQKIKDNIREGMSKYYIGYSVKVDLDSCGSSIGTCSDTSNPLSYDYKANCTAGGTSLGAGGSGGIGGCGPKGKAFELYKKTKECTSKNGLLDQPSPTDSTPSVDQPLSSIDQPDENTLLSSMTDKYDFLKTEAGQCSCPIPSGEPTTDIEMTPENKAFVTNMRTQTKRAEHAKNATEARAILAALGPMVKSAQDSLKAREKNSQNWRYDIRYIGDSIAVSNYIMAQSAMAAALAAVGDYNDRVFDDPNFQMPGLPDPDISGAPPKKTSGADTASLPESSQPTALMTPMQ